MCDEKHTSKKGEDILTWVSLYMSQLTSSDAWLIAWTLARPHSSRPRQRYSSDGSSRTNLALPSRSLRLGQITRALP